jgi:hypothetical protein
MKKRKDSGGYGPSSLYPQRLPILLPTLSTGGCKDGGEASIWGDIDANCSVGGVWSSDNVASERDIALWAKSIYSAEDDSYGH